MASTMAAAATAADPTEQHAELPRHISAAVARGASTSVTPAGQPAISRLAVHTARYSTRATSVSSEQSLALARSLNRVLDSLADSAYLYVWPLHELHTLPLGTDGAPSFTWDELADACSACALQHGKTDALALVDAALPDACSDRLPSYRAHGTVGAAPALARSSGRTACAVRPGGKAAAAAADGTRVFDSFAACSAAAAGSFALGARSESAALRPNPPLASDQRVPSPGTQAAPPGPAEGEAAVPGLDVGELRRRCHVKLTNMLVSRITTQRLVDSERARLRKGLKRERLDARKRACDSLERSGEALPSGGAKSNAVIIDLT